MELQIFENAEFGKVRTVIKDDEPWFVGKDVATALGFKNPRDAILTHVFDDDRGVDAIDTLGGTQEMTVINESGLYALVFGSRLQKAKEFKRWVTNDVLPSIRKHGAYMTEQTIEKALASPDFLIQLATKLKEEQTKNKLLAEKNAMQEQLIGELKPKADYVDTILCNKGTEPITTIAKDYGYSAKEFNKMLHNFGIQYKVGKQWVLYSEYQAQGYTHTKVYPDITDGLGNPIRGMEWTQKGRLFLYNFLKEKGIVPMIEQY